MDYFRVDAPSLTLPSKLKARWPYFAGAFLLVLLLIIGGIYWNNKRSLSALSISKSKAAADLSLAACKDNADCQSLVRTDYARQTGLTDYCQKLEGELKDNCLLASASKGLDETICQQGSTADFKTKCVDFVISAKNQAKPSASNCEKIVDDGLKYSCNIGVVNDAAQNGKCDSLDGEWKDICTSQVKFQQIISSRDYAACSQFTGSDVDNCHFAFGNIDDDKDGLNFLEELSAGTSDLKTDTDGDGFSDLVEIQTGHNPLAP